MDFMKTLLVGSGLVFVVAVAACGSSEPGLDRRQRRRIGR